LKALYNSDLVQAFVFRREFYSSLIFIINVKSPVEILAGKSRRCQTRTVPRPQCIKPTTWIPRITFQLCVWTKRDIKGSLTVFWREAIRCLAFETRLRSLRNSHTRTVRAPKFPPRHPLVNNSLDNRGTVPLGSSSSGRRGMLTG